MYRVWEEYLPNAWRASGGDEEGYFDKYVEAKAHYDTISTHGGWRKRLEKDGKIIRSK